MIAFGAEEDGGEAGRAVALARGRGCLTIGFSAPAAAEWGFEPPTGDADISQELIETLYHVLWELVHVFFEHRGLLSGRAERRGHDAGASSFLYPFLAEREDNLDEVLDDVRRSVLMKSRGDRSAARADAERELPDAAGGRRAAARAAGARRDAAGARQRRLGDRCDGRRRGLPRAGAGATRPGRRST